MLARILLTLTALAVSLSAQQVVALNGASFRVDLPGVTPPAGAVSPGAFASAFPPINTTFAGVTTNTTGTLPYGTSLAGVTVSLDDVNVPVQFVSSGQINFLVPYAIAPGLKVMKVTSPGGSISGNLRVIAAAPGLFQLLSDAVLPRSARALNQDGITVNTAAAPTKRGDVISLFGTGPGPYDRASLVDGAASGSGLVRTVSTPLVYVGGVPATVQFSGLNGNFPGLWQVNVTIPTNSFITGRVPVVIFMDGVDSNEVSIFVQ